MSNVLEDNTIREKLATPTSLSKCHFSYVPGMQKQWVENMSVFLDFVGSKYGQSVKASIEVGELIVTEVDESILTKFDTLKEETQHLETLNYWEQEVCTQIKENFKNFSIAIRQMLSSMHGTLYSICELSLRNRLEAQPEYQEMAKSK